MPGGASARVPIADTLPGVLVAPTDYLGSFANNPTYATTHSTYSEASRQSERGWRATAPVGVARNPSGFTGAAADVVAM